MIDWNAGLVTLSDQFTLDTYNERPQDGEEEKPSLSEARGHTLVEGRFQRPRRYQQPPCDTNSSSVQNLGQFLLNLKEGDPRPRRGPGSGNRSRRAGDGWAADVALLLFFVHPGRVRRVVGTAVYDEPEFEVFADHRRQSEDRAFLRMVYSASPQYLAGRSMPGWQSDT